MSTENNKELPRVIGVAGLALIVVNFSIGAGIFALPAIIGIQLGTAAFLGYFLCGLMFASIVLCYVEIGSRIKTTGGSYAYVEKAFGPLPGFIVNWLFFFGWGIIADAAVLNIVADSLAILFPVFSNAMMRGLLFFILIAIMISMNIRDSKKSVRFVGFVTVIKVIPLLALILFGLGHIEAGNLQIGHLPPLKAFDETALILFFALAGFETSLNVSGEIKNPKRTVPRGILIGGLTVFIIYLLIQIITQGVLGAQLIEFKDAPLAAVAEKIAGPAGAIVLLFAAAVSGFGSVNGDVLASSRLLYAGAKDGLFPGYLGKIHPRLGTPYLAVITFAVAIFIFAVSGGFKQLAILASGALLLIYLAVILSMLKLRMKKTEGEEKTFRVPGGMIIPGIAIVAILYVLSNLNKQEIVSIIIFVASVCIIYFVINKWQKKKKSPGRNKVEGIAPIPAGT